MTTVPPAAAADTVYELMEGSGGMSVSSKGLFRSIAGAQAEAARIHQRYLAMYADFTVEELEETEQIAAELDWNVEQRYLSDRSRVPVGDPCPVAQYSRSGVFHIRTRPVGP